MIFKYAYNGETSVKNDSQSSDIKFVPDALREPTYFIGDLSMHIEFREAISCLHDVVISDLKYRPKDRDEYMRWIANQEEQWYTQALAESNEVEGKLKDIQSKLDSIRTQKNKILKPYYDAQRKYFKYLYVRDYTAWLVLDPVISVHPDELFFECFSKDESTYGKLSCNHSVFKNVSDFKCGTTNIDYSGALYAEFQKIRDYKTTNFKIDPSGFEVKTTAEHSLQEMKIDLPDSWVRGFLQVSSAMNLVNVSFDLHPVDLANFLFILKRFKEKESPRYIEFVLEPGKPIKAVFAPWNKVVNCPRSIYKGNRKENIKIWGRRRLLILERLIPICKKITVHLMGTGLPSFYVADLGELSFTLGLSGWTANDWSYMGNFDLMLSREKTDGITQQKVLLELHKNWFASLDDLASKTGFKKSTVQSVLSLLSEQGKVIFDINKNVYRHRELSKENLASDELQFSNPKDKEALLLLEKGKVEITRIDKTFKVKTILGRADNNKVEITLNNDEQLKDAKCTCHYYYKNKLHKGPCEHMVAIRHLSMKSDNF